MVKMVVMIPKVSHFHDCVSLLFHELIMPFVVIECNILSGYFLGGNMFNVRVLPFVSNISSSFMDTTTT